MRESKYLVLVGVMVAVILATQYLLSGVMGLELVTALLVAFCLAIPFSYSLILVIAFLVMRNLIFGFYPSVLILYLIYYPLLAVTLRLAKGNLGRDFVLKDRIKFTLLAFIMVIIFYILDAVISTIYFGFTYSVAKAYVIASLLPLGLQELSVVLSVYFITPPAYAMLNSRVVKN